ncbi:MAG: hypothetical protein ACPGPS_19990, partial [Rubripirellula sp.]
MTQNQPQSETNAEGHGHQTRWRSDHPPDRLVNAKPRHKQPSNLASRLMGLETEYATLVLGT